MNAALLFLALTADLTRGERAAQAGDYPAAIAELRPLAEGGSEEAQNCLGAVYFKMGDYADAKRWLELGAAQGHPAPQVFLALMYQGGKGVERSYIQAAKWLILAARMDAKAAQMSEAIALQMTEAERAEAVRLAEEWKRSELYVPRPILGPKVEKPGPRS